MIANRILNATRTLGAPAGWIEQKDGHCGGLAIRDLPMEGGGSVMVSSWQPTPEEVAAINAGAPVLLMVRGTQHPPVHLEVGEPPR